MMVAGGSSEHFAQSSPVSKFSEENSEQALRRHPHHKKENSEHFNNFSSITDFVPHLN